MDEAKRDHPTRGISIPDAALRAFMREQAEQYFGGNVSRYLASLVQADRDEGHTKRRVLLTAAGLSANGKSS